MGFISYCHIINIDSSQPLFLSFLPRKRYVKKCQIQHTYGEDVEDDLVEEKAVLLTESAINDGTATALIIPNTITPAPNGAVVEVGGKKCKWCASTTHSRKSHKDCPYNNSRV